MVFKYLLKKRGSYNNADGNGNHSRRGRLHDDATTAIVKRATGNEESCRVPTSSRGDHVSASITKIEPIVFSRPPPTPRNANVAAMDAIPSYVQDLASTRHPGGGRAARALRKLFAISQHVVCSSTENLHDVTTTNSLLDGDLIPALFSFSCRCEIGSNERYLSLLILNNLSIPIQNKAKVALEHHGAKILSRMLCEDPSCHLIAIILINLTFVDQDLRGALVSPCSDIKIIESLSFALRVASLTKEEYEHRQPLVQMDPQDPKAASDLLTNLLEEDNRRQPATDGVIPLSSIRLPPSSLQVFPETTRWCLVALKNLARPSTGATTACTLVKLGIVPHILRFVTVESDSTAPPRSGLHCQSTPLQLVKSYQSSNSASENCIRDEVIHRFSLSRLSSGTHESTKSESDGSATPLPADPEEELDYDASNHPSTWDSRSAQDAALFIIMNLSESPMARNYIREVDAVHHLSAITACQCRQNPKNDHILQDELLEFQRLKARIALSFLLGSELYFAQSRSTSVLKQAQFGSHSETTLILTNPEVTSLVEVLAGVLRHRSKEGAGGYSAFTFNAKLIVLSLRRLLASHENQLKFARKQGPQLNALLLKVLALHSLQSDLFIDPEAAEGACLSLYLLSNYGFQDIPFLPEFFGNVRTHESIAAKVVTAYIDTESVTLTGKHAASQVLLRLKYLVFSGSAAELASRCGVNAMASDFAFESDLLEACKRVFVPNLKIGSRPDESIFDRPILRRKTIRGFHPRKSMINWGDNKVVDSFPNALQAVKDLSFNSTKVRHLGAIDEILIANNAMHCANGEKTESYNYIWSWQDTAGGIQRNLEQQNSSATFLSFGGPSNGKSTFEPLNVIDALCGIR